MPTSIKRNTGGNGYRYKQAHRFAQTRYEQKPKHIKLNGKLRRYIQQKLGCIGVLNKLAVGKRKEENISISTESIYRLVLQDKVAGGSLHQYLRHQGKKYRKRYDKNDYRGHIPNRVDIDDRPSIVDSRSRIGDWEADCVIGKGHQGVFATLAERESRLYLALQTKNKTAQVFAPEKPAYSTSLYIKRNQRGYTQVVRAYETTCDDTNL